ncbi:nitroreductase [Paraburkholderia sediminicola]|uniref:nitroreductase n=1 Tax=Paraburkholderia sediminicola TaxID=458836 RepID=UPI0038B7EC89
MNSEMTVSEALLSRRSVRAFTNAAIPREVIEQILTNASRAPSGTNTQPWKVYVVSGTARRNLCNQVLAMRETEPEREGRDMPFGEYEYYPRPMEEPYLGRCRKVGWDMYQRLGVEAGDRRASWKVAGRNFEFFGAPVGLIFTLDKVLRNGSWLDLGMFMQSIMLCARDAGLDSCAQGAWAFYYDVVRSCLSIPESEMVVCGMAIGFAEPDAVVNQMRTEREPLSKFARFIEAIPD